MAELEIYSNVWQKVEGKSEVARRFYVPGYVGYLPFFLSGHEVQAFENGEGVELREEHLLKGILFGLYEFDHSPKPWHDQEGRKTLLYLLDVLGKGFGFETPEKMILDTAFDLRKKNGNEASTTVLEVGTKLIPSSSRIKSDLVIDLWAVMSEKGEDSALLERIVSLVSEINLEDVRPDAREVVCYYGLCAMVFLKKEADAEKYLHEYIYPNVSMQRLKNNVKTLLENPAEVSMNDLRIL